MRRDWINAAFAFCGESETQSELCEKQRKISKETRIGELRQIPILISLKKHQLCSFLPQHSISLGNSCCEQLELNSSSIDNFSGAGEGNNTRACLELVFKNSVLFLQKI